MLDDEFFSKRENKKWLLNLFLSVAFLSLNQVFSLLSKNTYSVSMLEIFKISSTSAIIIFMGLFANEDNFNLWISSIKSWSRKRKCLWLFFLIIMSLLNYFIFDRFVISSLSTVNIFEYKADFQSNVYIFIENLTQYLYLIWNALLLWIEIASLSLFISLPINFIIAFSYDWIEKNLLDIKDK